MVSRLLLSLFRRIFSTTHFYGFNYKLYLLSLKGMGVLNYESDGVSGESRFISKVARRFNSPMILDVGGNEGNYAALCKQHSPDSTIYSFEPHPKTFERLAARAADLNFNAINAAASNVRETVTLYDYSTKEGSSHASLYSNVLSSLRGSEVQSVSAAALPLDDFLKENEILHVNLLKIDAEGHELKILQGAKQYITSNKIDLIHFEFNEMNVMSRTFMKDFYDLLPNYSLYRMLPRTLLPLGPYRPAHEIFLFQNIVAIRNDFDL